MKNKPTTYAKGPDPDADRLRAENARLRQALERLAQIANERASRGVAHVEAPIVLSVTAAALHPAKT